MRGDGGTSVPDSKNHVQKAVARMKNPCEAVYHVIGCCMLYCTAVVGRYWRGATVAPAQRE
jgi:hypothetical protein